MYLIKHRLVESGTVTADSQHAREETVVTSSQSINYFIQLGVSTQMHTHQLNEV